MCYNDNLSRMLGISLVRPSMTDIRTLFGSRLRKLRNDQGLSQKSLADQMGVSRTYISKIENGRQNPTLEKIYNISTCLNVSIHCLFQFE